MDHGDDSSAAGNDFICSVYTGKQNHQQYLQNPFLDQQNWKFFGTVGFFLAKAVKFVLSGIALVSLPLIFLLGIGIPLKILFSLKAMTLTNSVVLGSLVYRFLNRLRPMTDPDTTTTSTTAVYRKELLLDKGGTSMETDSDYPDLNEEKLQKIIENLRKKNKDW